MSRILCVGAVMGAFMATSAQAAPFKCSATAARVTVLGQVVAPVTANATGPACAGDSQTLTGAAAGFTGPLNVGAVIATTEVFPAKKSVVATGGIAELKVGSLPTLPITLPQVGVPDAARALLADALRVNVDLSGVKALIPLLDTNLITSLVTNLVTSLPTDVVTGLPTTLIDNTPTNLLSALTTVLPALPTSLREDLPTTLREDLPINLPTNLVVNPADPALDTIGEVTAQNNLNAAANAANQAANTANDAANTANGAANSANAAANDANALVNSLGAVIDTPGEALDALVWVPAANSANAAANSANAAANSANVTANAAAAAASAANAALNAANAALNLAHTVTNTTNALTNAANTATNAVRNSIPDSVAIDRSGALGALLAALLPANRSLPNLELLHVQGALAYAAGACQNGTPSVAGSSTINGVKVLGTEVGVDALVNEVRTLIESVSIDPSNLGLPAIELGALGLSAAQLDLIADVPLGAATNTLNDAIADALGLIDTALDGLDTIRVLDPTVAQIKVVPGARFQDATSVTQQGLTIEVSIAGQKVVEAVIGEAKASSAGVDCDDRVTDPSSDGATDGADGPGGGGSFSDSSLNPPGSPEEAALQCTTRKLVLVDVLERGNRVRLNGVADTSLAGKSVAIVFDATGKTVAHAMVAKDGSFDTTAALPPERLRDTNDARYMATLGKEESTNLKLRRRMIISSMRSDNGKVTIAGRVLPPLGKPLQAITLKRRVSCTREETVTRFKPRADGRFRITVNAPRRLATAVYRLTTMVRFSEDGSGMFKTYTLPRAVNLDR